MNYHEGRNIGGISMLELIRHNEINTINPLTLIGAAQWLKVLFDDEKGQLQEKEEDTPNGVVFTYSGTFFIHNQRNEVDNDLNPYLGKWSAMKVTDHNGRARLIGAPGIPILLEKFGDTGQRYTDVNGAGYSFTVNQPFPAIVL